VWTINLTATQHIFGRYNFWNLKDLPLDPLRQGCALTKCSETYQTNAAASDYNNIIRPNVILNLQLQRKPLPLLRSADEFGFASLNMAGRRPTMMKFSPLLGRRSLRAFTPQDPSVRLFARPKALSSDHDTQFAFSPSLTLDQGTSHVGVWRSAH